MNVKPTKIMNMDKQDFLSPTWLNGEYNVNGWNVTIDTGLSYACFEDENDEDNNYAFQGDEGDIVINEINALYNTENCTPEEAVGIWANLCLSC